MLRVACVTASECQRQPFIREGLSGPTLRENKSIDAHEAKQGKFLSGDDTKGILILIREGIPERFLMSLCSSPRLK
ncbi:hypothetical protein PK98_14680 [Croceibacterium mercuriale]|uniref:Uncharacterized protein n=1 Tax=Croceibacterium mercuriale TaxID=1572751 RepID=A0A0B2BRS6_9SPHN|nr:hypothetical protein PK98_14680 [Croceibacterium mercuriale]